MENIINKKGTKRKTASIRFRYDSELSKKTNAIQQPDEMVFQ
jgi:hypothetical protein